MTQHVQKDPYYAVIFTSKLVNNIEEGYAEVSKKMAELVKKQKGFISSESFREGKNGVTISYWDTMEDIRNWSMNERHEEAKQGGKEKWYERFSVKICKVEREYVFGE